MIIALTFISPYLKIYVQTVVISIDRHRKRQSLVQRCISVAINSPAISCCRTVPRSTAIRRRGLLLSTDVRGCESHRAVIAESSSRVNRRPDAETVDEPISCSHGPQGSNASGGGGGGPPWDGGEASIMISAHGMLDWDREQSRRLEGLRGESCGGEDAVTIAITVSYLSCL